MDSLPLQLNSSVRFTFLMWGDLRACLQSHILLPHRHNAHTHTHRLRHNAVCWAHIYACMLYNRSSCIQMHTHPHMHKSQRMSAYTQNLEHVDDLCVHCFFLRASGCSRGIRRLERQCSEIGRQAPSDKTCLEQTKAQLCCVGTSLDRFDFSCSSCRSNENLPEIFRCLSHNQSLVRHGGRLLRTDQAILRLITWQAPEGAEVLPT